MIEEAAGAPAPDPTDGQPAATSGDAGAPAVVGTPEAPSEWLDAASGLLGRDPDTGLVDTDQVLEAIRWLGQALFSHAKTDRAHHTKATLLEQIRSTQAVMNSIHAVQHVRVAQYAATAESADPDLGYHPPVPSADLHPDTTAADAAAADAPDDAGASHREHAHPLGHVCEFTDVDLAPALCWGPFQAVRRINDAVDAVVKTPRLLDEMGAGRLGAAQVAEVTGELVEAGDVTCARVQDRVLEKGVGGWTTRQTKSCTQTLVRRLDAAAAQQTKKKQIKGEIGSFTRPGPINGLTEWNLILPSEQALPAVRAVEDLARQLHQDQDGDKTLGQCRVDALCDLLLGHAEVSTTMTVLVPVKTTDAATNGATTSCADDRCTGGSTTGGSSGGWPVPEGFVEAMMTDINWDAALQRLIVDLEGAGQCLDPGPPDGDPTRDSPPNDAPVDPRAPVCLPDIEVPGLGVIPADAIQDMLRTIGTRLTRSLVDWRTGTLIETGCETYRPTDRIRRHVLQRDVHCRFPGCDRPARFCDVDHVIRWPVGATTVANLQALCRHHHRAKHETRWAVTMTPDGTCTWTSPSGRAYTTYPGSLEVTADLQVTPQPAETADAPDEVDLLETDVVEHRGSVPGHKQQ